MKRRPLPTAKPYLGRWAPDCRMTSRKARAKGEVIDAWVIQEYEAVTGIPAAESNARCQAAIDRALAVAA